MITRKRDIPIENKIKFSMLPCEHMPRISLKRFNPMLLIIPIDGNYYWN